MKQLISLASRLMFVGSFLLAALAVVEKLANGMGQTLTRGVVIPSRLLDLAALALLFVIALQLRELKTAFEGRSS
jgi:hypothetical protein